MLIQKFRSNILLRLQNNRGSALLVCYLAIVLLLGLGAAFALRSVSEHQTAERQLRTSKAFFIAEAGIERALFNLREDYINGGATPSWSDGDINGMAIGPDTANYYTVPFGDADINGGAYSVEFQNDAGTENIWVKSTGVFGDTTQIIRVYARMFNMSPWDNAIFAGAGASGTMVNGNVDIRGSVHILGGGLTSSDFAIDMGGTAELVGNNYNGLSVSMLAKVPALPTTIHNGETVGTLSAELRVKRGRVGLSGSASVGEIDVTGNTVKETVDGSFVTDGYGGNQGTANAHSDNGTNSAYDLGDAVGFPSLSDPYPGYGNYQDYLYQNALVLSTNTQLNDVANINPGSSFSYSNANGSISMDGLGNMTVSGIVYIDGGALNLLKQGTNKTITYTGSGSILATGDVQIDVDLITSGSSSYPKNVMGIMTPGQIGFNEAGIDVMGLFYAEGQVRVEKQTDIMGTIVSNYFDMGTNVPAIYQVPEVVNNLPPGLIGQEGVWLMQVVSWEKL